MMCKSKLAYIFVLLAVAVCICCASTSEAQESKWNRVIKQVNQEVVRAKEDVATTESMIKAEKERLLGELAELKDRVGKKEKALDKLKQHFDELRQKEDEMRSELEAQEEEIHTLEGAVKGASKDFDKILRTSLITPEFPDVMKKIEALAISDTFPSYHDIESLVNSLFVYIKSTGEIAKEKRKLIDRNGKEATGDVVRIGDFMCLYKTEENIGCSHYDSATDVLIAYPGKLPWRIRRAFARYMEGNTDHVPLDLSHGAIFKEFSIERGIMDWLRSGGFLVWPIILIGAVALVLILERLVFLNRMKKASANVMSEIDRMIREGRFRDCKEFCKKFVGIPVCKVITAGISNISASKDVLENALQEAILKELPKIEKFLPTLSVLAAIAPLLGLLGTVTGIINTFQVITQFGTSDPRMMSGGISEALVTTQLGLGVAIPILVMHHFLERQADKIIDEMEEKGTALTVSILKARDAKAEDTDVTSRHC